MPLSIQKLANRLTFRQPQVFKAVYDLKSQQSEDLLGLTQPAVSSQVRHLEQALGMPMFEYVVEKLYVAPRQAKKWPPACAPCSRNWPTCRTAWRLWRAGYGGSKTGGRQHQANTWCPTCCVHSCN